MSILNDPNMSGMDMLTLMSEGNPGALMVLLGMIQSKNSFSDIFLCDSLDIRGSKLYMLNNDCCGRNQDKFDRTLKMIRSGIFSMEEIHNNLDLVYAIPFIDDGIKIDGVPPYGEKFGPGHDKWDEFCQIQKESFTKRYNDTLARQKVKK